MGALVTKALRPIKTFNIENRAHRVISKEKPVPAPKYQANIEDLKRAVEADPFLDEKLQKKDMKLDERLKNIYVTSEGKPEDDITKEKQTSKRVLPSDRHLVQDYDYGFKEPENIPYGKTTLRKAVEFLSAHQMSPDIASIQKIAFEYKLKEEDVENVVKYFKTFEIFVPETKTTKATFAGPSHLRRQIEADKLKKITGAQDLAKLIQESNVNIEKKKKQTKVDAHMDSSKPD